MRSSAAFAPPGSLDVCLNILICRFIADDERPNALRGISFWD
jgi:hypothetical protein